MQRTEDTGYSVSELRCSIAQHKIVIQRMACGMATLSDAVWLAEEIAIGLYRNGLEDYATDVLQFAEALTAQGVKQ